MNHPAAYLALLLTLSPCLASAKDLCIQLNDNGDVLVLKGIGKGSKLKTAYLADFISGGTFSYKPLSGSAIVTSDGRLRAGFIEHGVQVSSSGSGTSLSTHFHRVSCDPGTDGKLSLLDDCSDSMNSHPSPTTLTFRQGHVVDCPAIPPLP